MAINVTFTSNSDQIILKDQPVSYTAVVAAANSAAAVAYTNAVATAAADATAKVASVSTLASVAYINAITYSATDASTKAATAYINAISIAATDASTKADIAYSNALSSYTDLFAPLSGANFTGPIFGVTVLGTGNTTITGFANVTTTLQVGTNTATFGTAAYLVANGNLGIGTATPSNKLQVAGNVLVTGGNIGIGSSVPAAQSLSVSKDITGGVTSYGLQQSGTVQSDVTASARGFNNTLSVNNNTTFTMTQYMYYSTATTKPAILNTTITNSYGYLVDVAAVAGVSNYGYYGQIPSSSTSTISRVSLTTNVVTVTTAAAHVFWPGQTIVVAATTTTSINGSFTILTCPSTTTFTYALVLADIVSTADTGSATVSTGRWNAYMQGTAPNYFAGQVTVGATNVTNGYLAVAGTQSVATSMLYVGGTNSFTGTTPIAIYCNPTLTGTSAMTNAYGFNLVPTGTFAAGATMTTYGGINCNPALNSATTPSNYYGVISQLGFNAAALGGTVAASAAYIAPAPTFNAATTTNITTYAGFRASGVANGTNQSITNIYAFQGQQATSASSNAYNLYMSGTAKNYLAGNTGIGNTMPDATLAVTGTANVSGIVNFGSTLNVAGQLNTNNSITSLTATSKVNIGTDSGGSISLGRTDGTASAPYIDFNSSATAVDYDARISVGAGTGTVGNATLTIAAGKLAAGNTAITGTVDITDPINAATATPTLRTINGAHYFAYIPRAGGGSYNDLVVANDSAVIFSNGTTGYGGLTISPWAAGIAGGIRLAASAGVVTVGITGATTITGALTTSSYSKTTATIVGSLVAAATAGAGARSFVTDSTVAASGNFGAIVAGTGSNAVPVYSDGTNWRIG